MKPFLFLLAVVAAAIITVTAVAVFPGITTAQGPLTPPGPPGPTMKTLDQLQPRTPISTLPAAINSPGSYYLTGNLTATSNTVAIVVAADNVTIDLSGFTLSGAGKTGSGIATSGTRKNLYVHDGTISDWTGTGLVGSNLSGGTFEKLRLLNNSGGGLSAGSGAIVRGCVANGSSSGIGISAGSGSTVSDCTSTANLRGISVDDRSTLVNSTCSGNASNGIVTGPNCTLSNCTASGNGSGIQTASGCTISSCTANANNGNGIYVGGSNSTISICTASENSDAGIYANGFYATISGCTASTNGGSGIVLFGNSFVSGCTVAANNRDNSSFQAGIYIYGDACRIDGNYFTNNNYAGLVAETNVTKTFIVRNVFHGAQFILRTPAGNVFGPFEDHSASGGQIATTSPFANIGD